MRQKTEKIDRFPMFGNTVAFSGVLKKTRHKEETRWELVPEPGRGLCCGYTMVYDGKTCDGGVDYEDGTPLPPYFEPCKTHRVLRVAVSPRHRPIFVPVECAEPIGLKAFQDKLRRRGFKDPSPEAQERNRELGELYMEDTKP